MPRFWLGLMLAVVCAVAPTTAQAVVRADRDHDKVFDDLESRLTGTERIPILVSLDREASAARVAAIRDAVGDLGQVTRFRVLDAFAARATPAQIRAVARRADVVHVEEDARVIALGVSAQNAFGIARAREELPDLDGRGTVAAVLDSGIDVGIPDLPPSKVIGWKDLVSGRETPYDDAEHGTLVSSVLAGTGAGGPEGRGVAPGAKLVGVKVIDERGMSSLGLIAQGIEWVIESRVRYGIDAMNLSIGDPVGCGDGKDVASQAVDAAVAAGILVVIAAGNSGPAHCTVKSPAAAESALTVGAMADTSVGGFAQAWFSSRGPTADGRIKPDISAAGVNVPVAKPGGGYSVGSGTSVAAPFTTGTALLMLQANPTLTPAQIKHLIMSTAVDWGQPGRDVEYGAGRLDAYAALRAAGAPLAVPPAVPDHHVWGESLSDGEGAHADIEVTDSRFPLSVTLLGPSAGFDLSVRDANGQSVGTMTPQPGQTRQEDITVAVPAPGRYTVGVEAREGSGAFVVDISAALAPKDTTAPGLSLAPLPMATNDPTPELHGEAGSALGDFRAVVARVVRNGQSLRRLAATPRLGRWSAEVTPPLAEGAYTVEVEQGDSAGNVARRSRVLVVDTTAPAAPTITAAVQGADARFRIDGEAGATLQCRVDAGAWGACASLYTGFAPGSHVFEARAVDAAGNVGPAARFGWTVASPRTPPVLNPTVVPPTLDPVPVISLSVRRQRLATVRRRGLSVRVGCSPACRLTLTIRHGRRAVARRTLTGRAMKTVRLNLSAKTRKRLATARRVTFAVTATSPGATTVTKTITVKR